MKTKLQVDIWTETREQIVTRRSGWCRIWCDRCFDETFWFRLPAVTEPVAIAIGRSLEADRGPIHFLRSGDGRISVCLRSLSTIQNAFSGETK